MESHKAGFPPFPHSLEIPSGFPHSHGLDDWIYVFSCPLNSNHRDRKGLVTDVSGPQRNPRPGTLTAIRVCSFNREEHRTPSDLASPPPKDWCGGLIFSAERLSTSNRSGWPISRTRTRPPHSGFVQADFTGL